MGPRTPCPHPIRLRQFLRDRERSSGADLVREHLAQCETCRSVLARIESGQVAEQNCLVESLAQSSQAIDDNGAPGFRYIGEVSEGTTIIELTVGEVIAPTEVGPVSKPGRMTSPAPAGLTSDAMSTCLIPPAGDSDTALFGRTDSANGSEPGTSTTMASESDSTCVIVPGAGPSESESFVLTESPAPEESSGDTSEFIRVAVPNSAGSSEFQVARTLRDPEPEPVSKLATLENVSVPGYDILEELGRGGMGVVYKARDRRLQRLVALKMVLAGAHVGAVGLARFRAEAEAVAKLSHANIVQIYETGEHEGRPYFALELVDGGSLDQKILESPASPRAAASFIETLARTMAVAHERGIVHRDLKPANILLARIGSQSSIVRSREADSNSLPADHWSRSTIPKIADFGLAKQVDDDSSQTKSGTIMGTPSYMAPEQASGKNREIGPAADIYSLGRDPVRAAGGPSAVQGRQSDRHDPPGDRTRPDPAAPARAAGSARSRDNLPEMSRERPGAAILERRRTG